MEPEKAIKKYRRKYVADLNSDSIIPVNYEAEDIKKIIPHREPFFFLDAITGIDLENEVIIGRKSIDKDDPVFKGHFPEAPVYPGLLQIEIIGQLAVSFYPFFTRNSTELTECPGLNVRVVRLNNALFQAEVKPGDDIIIIAKLLEHDEYMYRGIGQIISNGKICTIAIGEFYLL
jgi:3-hydroxymyristoyl/3-hydroxydecanoyl-(acyl carrier protein) dehydratase